MLELFSELELMPQFYEELDGVSKEKRKRLGFKNDMENSFVQFNKNKILITKGYNPFEEGASLERKLEEFVGFSSRAISSCGEFIGGGKKSPRVSLVGEFLEAVEEDEGSSKLKNDIPKVASWCDGPLSEIRMRTGESGLLNTGEGINILVSLNDGTIEKNTDGMVKKQPCYLVQLDINTKPENSESRFSVDAASESWSEMSRIMLGKTDRVHGFFSS